MNVKVIFTDKAEKASLFISKIGTPPKGREMLLDINTAKDLEKRGFLKIQKSKTKTSVKQEGN